MSPTVPPAPAFGAPCPIDPSAETLVLLAARRSSSARALTAPGPDADQLDALLRLATRVPDHGKLAPWRFVILSGEAKNRYVAALRVMARRQDQPDKAEAALIKVSTPPLTVAVVASPKIAKIPDWEQVMSAGAVCMNLLIAAQAMGFGANWITDWYAFDAEARTLLGARDEETIAGFIHLGTAAEIPLERVRPDLGPIVQIWG